MNKNTNKDTENKKDTLVYSGGKEYYQHLKDMKSDTSMEKSEYSTTFMMF